MLLLFLGRSSDESVEVARFCFVAVSVAFGPNEDDGDDGENELQLDSVSDFDASLIVLLYRVL